MRAKPANSGSLGTYATHIIKMLGRWESMAYARYIRTPREQLIPVSARLAETRLI